MKVGLIGIGDMGLPMARNQLPAGRSLGVHNRAPGRAGPFASLLCDPPLTAIANGKGEMDWAALARLAAENAGLGRAGPTD